MLDPTRPDPTGVAAARDLERRVEALERSNQLLASTITGGTLVILDDSAVAIAVVGEVQAGVNGLVVYTAAGSGAAPMLSVNQSQGFAFPWFSSEWKAPTDSVVVTSGTFATQWTSTTELMFSTEILFRLRIVVDAATTAEAKVLVTAVDGTGGGQLGTTLSLSAATDAVREFRAAHGQTLGGGPIMFSVQVRRVSGAGNVTVYHPHPLHYGAGLVGAVVGGWV